MQTDREGAGTVSDDPVSGEPGADQPTQESAASSPDAVAPEESGGTGEGDDSTTPGEGLGTRADVESLGECKRRIKAFIPHLKVKEELDRNYKELASTVQIPGFRKGRVPRALLEKRFGKEIISDVKQALLSASLAEVIEAQKLDVVGSPAISDVELAPDADMSYVVDLEVRPEFDLDSYKGVEVARELVPVKDEDVNERLDGLRRKAAKLEPIDVAAANADSVYIGKYSLHRDGAKVKSGVEVSFVPATKVLGRFFVEDLEERVKSAGLNSGSPLKLHVRVPGDFPDEVLRNQEVELEFYLEETRRSILPELDADFARTLGKESVDDLSAEIRQSIEEWTRREADRKVEAKILEKVINSVAMPIPEGLVESIVNRRRLEREYELLERGVPPEEVKAALVREWGAQKDGPAAGGKEGAENQPTAASEEIRREIKEFFILEKIASKEKIFATEEEVDKRVQLMASLYGVPPGRLREELRSSGKLEELRYSLRNEKVRAFLRKEARILGPDGQPEAAAP